MTQSESMIHQINIRLCPQVRDRFAEYAREIGLADSELARLLIVRELCIRRLATTKGEAIQPPSQRESCAAKPKKLTAHFRDPGWVAKFDAYATDCGYRREPAARLVIMNELREQWLARALRWPPSK